MTRDEAVLKTLPGTSLKIAIRTNLSLGVVRKILRDLRDTGVVIREAQWTSKYGYTWRYRRVLQ